MALQTFSGGCGRRRSNRKVGCPFTVSRVAFTIAPMPMNGIAASGFCFSFAKPPSRTMSSGVAPSYGLRALGGPDELAHGSVRFGLGRFPTEAEIDYGIDDVTRVVRRLRCISPSYELARNS